MSKRKVFVILENAPDCELERREVEFEEGDDASENESLAIHDVIETWTLNAGDTIKIREV